MSKNPFSHEEDNLQIWLKNSKEFKQLSQKEWVKSRQKIHFQPKFNIFMSAKNFFHKLNRTAVVGLGIVLFSTTVGVSTQIVAPEQYKPSSSFEKLFQTNKQTDKNPYKVLASDTNNSVIELESSNIRLKYPNKFEGKSVVSGKNTLSLEELEKDYIETMEYFKKNGGADLEEKYHPKPTYKYIKDVISIQTEESNPLELLTIETSETNKISLTDWMEMKGVTLDSVKTIMPKQLQELTGWFLTNENLEDIYLMTIYSPDSGEISREVFFSHKGINYSIRGNSGFTNIKPGSVTGDEASKKFEELMKTEEDPFNPEKLFGIEAQIQFIK